MNYCVDSSVWYEYFQGNYDVRFIEEYDLVISIIAIAELADKVTREDENFDPFLEFIQSRALILSLSTSICIRAATIKKLQRQKHTKFGLADALHYACAQEEGAILVTFDQDFRGLENVKCLTKE